MVRQFGSQVGRVLDRLARQCRQHIARLDSGFRGVTDVGKARFFVVIPAEAGIQDKLVWMPDQSLPRT